MGKTRTTTTKLHHFILTLSKNCVICSFYWSYLFLKNVITSVYWCNFNNCTSLGSFSSNDHSQKHYICEETRHARRRAPAPIYATAAELWPSSWSSSSFGCWAGDHKFPPAIAVMGNAASWPWFSMLFLSPRRQGMYFRNEFRCRPGFLLPWLGTYKGSPRYSEGTVKPHAHWLRIGITKHNKLTKHCDLKCISHQSQASLSYTIRARYYLDK